MTVDDAVRALVQGAAMATVELQGAALVNLLAKELDVEKSERFTAAVRTGADVDERLRAVVAASLEERLERNWIHPEGVQDAWKRVGLSAKKIVNQAAPKPKKETPKKPAKKKPGARARRRSKKSADVSTAGAASDG